MSSVSNGSSKRFRNPASILAVAAFAAAPIRDIAAKRVICVDISDDMGAVAKVLADNHLKKAPVLRDGRMVGIINRSNITGFAVREYLGRESR